MQGNLFKPVVLNGKAPPSGGAFFCGELGFCARDQYSFVRAKSFFRYIQFP